MRKLFTTTVILSLLATILLSGCSSSYQNQARSRKYRGIMANDRQRAIHDTERALGFDRASRLSIYQVNAE